ncbi:hypothetical protein [Mycolicibacterium sp.]|uniref:hypothetical protein n=1 Tax=Mycolicibacterium sp. TaxID=2320850 RepID=UPI00355E8E18
MSTSQIGETVRVHVRGKDYLAEVIAASRSRVTVRYTDVYGEERIVKLPLMGVQAA